MRAYRPPAPVTPRRLSALVGCLLLVACGAPEGGRSALLADGGGAAGDAGDAGDSGTTDGASDIDVRPLPDDSSDAPSLDVWPYDAGDSAPPGDGDGDGATGTDAGPEQPDADGADLAAPFDDAGPTDSTSPSDTVDPGDTVNPSDTVDPGGDTAAPPPLYPARYPAGQVHSPITPWVAKRLAEIHTTDPALQDDVFMKVGASTSVSSSNLKCLATEAVSWGDYASLGATRSYYLGGDAGGSDPFSRTTLAAKSGVSTPWALAGNPSPLEQEYLEVQPRLAFVHYGTNDMQQGSTYQSALWPFGEALWTLTDELVGWGVAPVLVTLSRRLDNAAADEWVPTYNAVIAGLAQGRQVPLMDIAVAYEPLPNHGLGSDGLHGNTAPGGACQFTDEGLQYGFNTRNLQSLVALERLRSGLQGEALDPPGPALEGDGTLDAPYVIESLPFSDLRSTADGPPSALDLYVGCASTADESGPERVYVYTTVVPTRVRALVVDHGTIAPDVSTHVDIDVHLLDETGSEAGCLARAHRLFDADLEPGTYYFVLDTFVSGGVEKAGEYLFVLQQLP